MTRGLGYGWGVTVSWVGVSFVPDVHVCSIKLPVLSRFWDLSPFKLGTGFGHVFVPVSEDDSRGSSSFQPAVIDTEYPLVDLLGVNEVV